MPPGRKRRRASKKVVVQTREQSDSEEEDRKKASPRLVKVSKKEKKKSSGKPVPDRILKLTHEQYRKAMDFLEGPDPLKKSLASEYLCNDTTFTTNRQDQFQYLLSDTFLFQELNKCLEQGDLDGFLVASTGAFGTRKAPHLKNDMILAALYALFYHPAAKDPEVFQRCLESLFNTPRTKFGGYQQILDVINKAFEFESEDDSS